jgi:hypothetical protein
MEWNPLNWGKADIDKADYQLGDLDLMRNQAQQGMANAQQAAPMSQAAQIRQMQQGQAARLAGGPQSQARGMQMGLAQQLQRIASGQQQGAGELATQRQVSQGLAAQQAAARMARGANQAGGAGLGAARNMAQMTVAGAGQSQQAALQDQANAMGQLGQVSGQMRGQDVDFAGQNAQLMQQMGLANLGYNNNALMQQAGFNQQTGLANQQAMLQNRGQNDAAALAYLQQLYGINMGQAGLQAAYNEAQLGNKGIFPDLLQAGGTIGAAAATSDERAKTDVREVGDEVDATLAALKPYAFRYIDEDAHGVGARIGVMAQELEQTELGRALVIERNGVKMLDTSAALSLALAANVRLAQRLDDLERKVWEKVG